MELEQMKGEMERVIGQFRNESHDELDRLLQPIIERIGRLNRLIQSVREFMDGVVEMEMEERQYRAFRNYYGSVLRVAQLERRQLEKMYRKYSIKREKLYDYLDDDVSCIHF